MTATTTGAEIRIERTQVEDLPKLAGCAAAFYAASKFLKRFDIARFVDIWSGFIAGGMGVIFSLVNEAGEVVGVIGGIAHPDLYSGDLIASEFFWFVQRDYRGAHGMKLYFLFEKWAREEKRCSQIRMACLMDSNPDQMAALYERMGYQLCEQQFVKELNP